MNTPSIFGAGRNVPSINQNARAGLKGPAHPRISIRGGAFTLMDAGGQEYAAPVMMHPSKRVPMLLCIIVGANGNKSKMYYPADEQWTPDSNMPPVCFSDNGIAPSEMADDPQAATCAECHWNKWGSAKSRLTGKDVKACADRKKLAVQVIGDTTNLTYELTVPPASLNNLADYSAKLAAKRLPGGNREPDLCDAVTIVNFLPGQTGILEFDQIAWIDSIGITPQGVTHLCYDANGIQQASDGGWAVAQRLDAIWQSGVVDIVTGARDRPWQQSGQKALPGAQHAPAQYRELPAPPHPQGAYGPPPGMSTPSLPTTAFGGASAPAPLPPPNNAPQVAAGPAPEQQSQSVPSRRGGARSGAGRKPRGQQAEGNVVQHPAMQQPHNTPQMGDVPGQPGMEIPPFLQRANQSPQGHVGAGASTPVQGGPQGASGQVGAPQSGNGSSNGNFGMTGAAPPPPGLEAALGKAFELKTE